MLQKPRNRWAGNQTVEPSLFNSRFKIETSGSGELKSAISRPFFKERLGTKKSLSHIGYQWIPVLSVFPTTSMKFSKSAYQGIFQL